MGEGDEPSRYRQDLPSSSESYLGFQLNDLDVNVDTPTTTMIKSVSRSMITVSPRAPTDLRLLSHLNSGRLWDTFRAVRTSCFPETVVLKTKCPATFSSFRPTADHLTENEARAGIFREDEIYRSDLEPYLLSSALPRYIGL